MSANNTNTMLQAALSYAEKGFKVFPVKPRGKNPITTHGLKDCTQTQLGVKEYWAKYPDANIGIVTNGDKLRSLKELIDMMDTGEFALPSEIAAKSAPEEIKKTLSPAE